MRALLLTLLASLSLIPATASAAEGATAPAPDKLPSTPGTVLSESSRDLGRGFRRVSRSQVNGPGSFEGVGHFVFVYYRDDELCRCSDDGTVIAPDGKQALFVDTPTGRLTLFQAATGARTTLTEDFAGHPVAATWEATRIVVTLRTYTQGVAHTSQQAFPR